MSADKQLKAYVDRVLRLKEERDTIGDDIREVYAEAKGEGYDKTIMGKLVVHLRKVAKAGADAVDEAECVFDTYLQAYHRASGTPVATHTHEEEFDPATGEFRENEYASAKLAQTVVTGMQTEAGRAALTAAVDIMIAREEAETESPRKAAEAVSERTATQVEAMTASAEATIEGQPSVTVATSAESAGEAAGIASDLPTNQPETATKSLNDGDCSTVEQNGTATAGTAVTAGETATNYDFGTIKHMEGQLQAARYSPIAPASHGEAEAPSDGSEPTGILAGETSSAANTGGDDVDEPHNAATHQAGALVEPAPAAPGYFTYEDFPPVPMKRTSFAHCFPELSARDYDALGTDIGLIGVQDPIVRHGNVILDGWARYNIARNLGIQYPVVEYDGEDELLDVIRWQRAARNFTPTQSKKIAADLAKEVPHRASEIMAAFEIEMEDA
jgi:uncharacterized protein (UPF0335 family)